jgi:hypothetical protein
MSSRDPVFIEVDHPNYRAAAQLDQAVRGALAGDFPSTPD